MKTFSRLWQYLAEFFVEWEIYQIKVVEKIKTHILCSAIFFPPSNRTVYEIMSKNMMEPERTQTIWRQRMPYGISKFTRGRARAGAHARTHTLTHNTDCFSKATVVSWTRLSVTLYVHCLSCFFVAFFFLACLSFLNSCVPFPSLSSCSVPL
jgi:hypothetical protein